MRVKTHRKYDKTWAKLTQKQQLKVLSAIKHFLVAPDAPELRLHQLKGEFYPQYSISAGGDLRVHFLQKEDFILLMLVGTHSQLYS